MSTENDSRNPKRQLESPEYTNQGHKLLKPANLTLPPESGIQSNSLSHSTPSSNNLEERDRAMLEHFEKIITAQFSSFTTTYIAPLSEQVNHWKRENEQLKQGLQSCLDRIESLEKVIRETNLVFTNVPSTSNYERSIEDYVEDK